MAMQDLVRISYPAFHISFQTTSFCITGGKCCPELNLLLLFCMYLEISCGGNGELSQCPEKGKRGNSPSPSKMHHWYHLLLYCLIK